jgi:1-acyl-sn-glycerol-3-phosphate acyltransferase
MKILSGIILRLMGWKINAEVPENINKCVLVMGPHTSNWDFVIGRLAFFYLRIKPKIIIKKELFRPPLGWILKGLGGIPVDRKKKNNMTDYAVNLFGENEKLFLLFTPEGTRKYNPNWKKGFYYIAKKANVPIVICFMDYSTKTGGIFKVIEPMNTAEETTDYIKSVLRQFKGKFPEKGIN